MKCHYHNREFVVLNNYIDYTPEIAYSCNGENTKDCTYFTNDGSKVIITYISLIIDQDNNYIYGENNSYIALNINYSKQSFIKTKNHFNILNDINIFNMYIDKLKTIALLS